MNKKWIGGSLPAVSNRQPAIVGAFPNATNVVSKVAQAIASARQNELRVIYITVGFRQGAPAVSTNNKGVAAAKQKFGSLNMDEFARVHLDLAPQEGDIIVLKRRLSAFSGSDLDMVLRAFGIQHLVLTGLSTGGVLLSTLREAVGKDYRLTVLADCCADADEEVHRVLTTKIFPRHADVFTGSEYFGLPG